MPAAPDRLPGLLLRPENVVLDIRAANTDQVFLQAARRVKLRTRDADALIAGRLARRHARRSTALGGGIALPHAEITHLGTPQLLYLRLAQGLPMGAPDGRAVRHVFVLLVPKPASSRDHQRLVELTHGLRQPGLAAILDRAGSAEAVCRRVLGDALA